MTLAESVNKRDEEAIIRAFMDEEEKMGINDIDVYELKETGFNGFEVTSNVPLSSGESEWLVFEDEDEAKHYATYQVREDMEDDIISMFKSSFVEEFTYITDTDKKLIADDIAEMRCEDLKYEGDLSDEEIDSEVEAYYDEVYKELDTDPMNFFVNELGSYTEEEYYKLDFVEVDIDEASKEAVRIAGITYFLDYYDGEEKVIHDPKTKRGFYIYGTN